jgi:hypothetical protein
MTDTIHLSQEVYRLERVILDLHEDVRKLREELYILKNAPLAVPPVLSTPNPNQGEQSL